MTSFSSQNGILIELPEGGQVGQKWAKIRHFTNIKVYKYTCTSFNFKLPVTYLAPWAIFRLPADRP